MTSDSSFWMRLNVEQLRTFLVVSEELSFRRAADRLHMASSPVSRRIKELEAAMGTKLFERDTRHVFLTEAGSALLPLARDVVQRFEALRWTVAGDMRPSPSVVKVGMASGAHPSDCGILMELLRRTYPASEIVPEVGTSVTLLSMLRSGQLVCSLIHLPVPENDIAVMSLREDELGVALGANHPLADEPSVAIGDLVTIPCAILRQRPEPEAAMSTRVMLDTAGVRRIIYIDSDWPSDVANYVASTNSFAIAPLSPESPLRRHFQDPRIVVRPLKGLRLSLQTGIAWLSEREKLDPALHNIIRELKRSIQLEQTGSGDPDPAIQLVEVSAEDQQLLAPRARPA